MAVQSGLISSMEDTLARWRERRGLWYGLEEELSTGETLVTI
jgi:hypothetical protein